jgi:hypothetical protein
MSPCASSSFSSRFGNCVSPYLDRHRPERSAAGRVLRTASGAEPHAVPGGQSACSATGNPRIRATTDAWNAGFKGDRKRRAWEHQGTGQQAAHRFAATVLCRDHLPTGNRLPRELLRQRKPHAKTPAIAHRESHRHASAGNAFTASGQRSRTRTHAPRKRYFLLAAGTRRPNAGRLPWRSDHSLPAGLVFLLKELESGTG